ncbi:MAG TPA: hypothetical protein PKI77_15795, partial [Mycobacterium sp.]|nr:hypothetical protein [Mycobacterium sp.]
MGWHNGPPSWAKMQRVLESRPAIPDGDGGDSPAWSRKRAGYRAPGATVVPSAVPYAELHAHSAFSFLDGAST